jgi:malonyl-CoA O-methyltransferase
MTPPPSKIARQFNKHAITYDDHAGIQHAMALATGRELHTYGRPDAEVLEVGCGTGDLTAILLDERLASRIVAVDIAEDMIEQARSRIGQRPAVDFILADAESLEWADQFDAVASSATIQWFRAPALTMARLKKSLKAGGVMVHSTFGPRTFERFFSLLSTVEMEQGIVPTDHRPPMLSLEQWDEVFASLEMECLVMRSEIIDVQFENSRAWLRSLRGTGAAINSGAVAELSSLRLAMRRYDEEYSGGSVPITHEILSLVTRRADDDV